MQTNGKVSVATGVGTQGQGHFTSFAQIVADELGVDVRDIDIVTGDTDQFYWGAGTFASRGAVVAGNAVNEASKVVRKKALKLASDLFECSEDDLGTSTGCRLEALTGARVNGPNFRGNLEALEQSVGSNRFWPEPGWLWDQRSANRLSP